MKTNIKNLFYTLIGCSALALGTTSCQEEPALEVGSKWLVTEEYYAVFNDGVEDEDYRYEMDVEHSTAQYWYILSKEEIASTHGYSGETGKYFYDENTQLLKITYKYNGIEYAQIFEVIEKTADTLVIRIRSNVDYESEYNVETGRNEITSVTEEYHYTKLVKQ